MGLVLAAALAGVADARGDDDAIQGDLKVLPGTWTAPAFSGGEVVYTFKGKILTIEAPSRSYTMTVTLDPAARPEKTIDFRIDEGPKDAKGKTSKGIYKLDGEDKFTFCMRPQGERPTEYKQEGFEQFVYELKRKKAEGQKDGEEKPGKASAPAVEPRPAAAEAPLPLGWPGATKPGTIEVKKYPVYRSAIVRKKDMTARGGEESMFFTLFNHIARKGVEMTAPVVSTFEPKVAERVGERGEVSMEFLYGRPDLGEAGPGVGSVQVEDHPAMTFVCLGIQGEAGDEQLPEQLGKLRDWLRDHKDEWVEAGPPRRLGYHSPMTPAARRLWEVQIPIKPSRAEDEPKDGAKKAS
jgi:uncharacterized protein (TIGR03067 family)